MTITKINGNELAVKDWQGQRVVTFKDIDMVHQRPTGTAKRNFNNNISHFEKDVDYFEVTRKEFSTKFVPNESVKGNPQLTVILFTEFGYLLLVKAFTDDLAWKVQRELIKSYFRAVHSAAAPQASASSNCIMINNTLQALQSMQQQLTDCSMQQGYQLLDHEGRIAQTKETVSQHDESLAELTNSVDNNYLPAYKWDEVQEVIRNFAEDIDNLKNVSRLITIPEAEDRRFHGDKDTLSDDEYDAQCASDLPSKEFAKWAMDTVHKVARKQKLVASCGRVWTEAYKGIQLPNGKQVQHLSELLDETYVHFRYIFALRLTKALNA